jgi:glycosyltransferase involved in cell wall biosynthesis
MTPRRIGFVSTRFAGTDGVSMETRKWVQVLTRLGHACYFFAGESDYSAASSHVLPLAHFLHPDIRAINDVAFSQRARPRALTETILAATAELKHYIYAFVRTFDIELLIVENALTIPLNLPLGIALTEFLAESNLPAVAHHHDFFWERQRLLVGCVWDYLDMSFPPHLPNLRHVVINSLAGEQLSLRTHVFALLIPNVMDFETPPPAPDDYAADVRAELGLAPDDAFVLQPTRIVPRKGIEHAIELVARLGIKAQLVISHASGDEGDAYAQRVCEYAALLNVPLRLVADRAAAARAMTADGKKIYALADLYQHADLVTYPSNIEGFGNAFLEAIYFKRPIVVNNYSVFNADIRPRDFRVIEFDGYITDETIAETRRLLEQPARVQEMVEHNYATALKHYSFAVLSRRLETILAECFGE